MFDDFSHVFTQPGPEAVVCDSTLTEHDMKSVSICKACQPPLGCTNLNLYDYSIDVRQRAGQYPESLAPIDCIRLSSSNYRVGTPTTL